MKLRRSVFQSVFYYLFKLTIDISTKIYFYFINYFPKILFYVEKKIWMEQDLILSF